MTATAAGGEAVSGCQASALRYVRAGRLVSLLLTLGRMTARAVAHERRSAPSSAMSSRWALYLRDERTPT
jgi:hypothetical protein